MNSVLDVAQYILSKRGEMSTMKLQKLIYYSQAWSLVWDGRPLFAEEIQAWANGPVVRELFHAHQGQFQVSEVEGDSTKLDTTQIETIDAVLEAYGDLSGFQLSDLTHRELPWLETREKAHAEPGARCSEAIPLETIQEFYGGLCVD